MNGLEGSGGRGDTRRRWTFPLLDEMEALMGGRAGRSGRVLRYSGKGARGIAAALQERGLDVYPFLVAGILKENGYDIRPKTGMDPDEAEERFKYIEKMARAYIKRGEPVVVIEGKAFDRRRGTGGSKPPYDREYLAEELERDIPSGGYHVFRRLGFVTAGLAGSGARTALGCLGRCWGTARFDRYRDAERMLIIADFYGGEWTVRLQGTANEVDKKVRFLRYPPGITRWNQDCVEHRFYWCVGEGEQPFRRMIIITALGTGGDTGLSVDVTGGGAGDANVGFRGWECSVAPRKRTRRRKLRVKEDLDR